MTVLSNAVTRPQDAGRESSARPQVEPTEFLTAVFHTLPDNAQPMLLSVAQDAPQSAWEGWALNPRGVLRLDPEENCYFSIASIRPSGSRYRRRLENAEAVHAIVLDDIGSKVDADRITLEPSWIVETSPDNCQYGYILRDPIAPQEAKRLLNALAASGWMDPNAKTAVHWMRLPFGQNCKPPVVDEWGEPFPVTLHHWSPGRVYSPQDLTQGFRLDLPPDQSENAPQGATEPATEPDALDVSATHEALCEAAKNIVTDAARRTHDDPTLGRHSEIVRMAHFARRDGVPEEQLGAMLQVFAQTMRPTDTSGVLKGIDWEKEYKGLVEQYRNPPEPDRKKAEANEPEVFSLDQFVLNGESATMKQQMQEDVFILGRLALLGQTTVFYAQPNVGKTLLTMRLLMDSIHDGTINGEDVYYINADDHYKGLTYKLELAEKSGFKMLAPGHKGFKAEMLTKVLTSLIQNDQARGKVLILDTVKKFTDIMRKDKTSEFMESVRQFISNGGSAIMLAHVNKNRDEDGKVVFAGTSDMYDDCDCAYTIDFGSMKMQTMDGNRIIKFQNFKCRGDVDLEAVYQYNGAQGVTYGARLESVRLVSDKEKRINEQEARVEAKLKRNHEAINAIMAAIREGVTGKTEIIKAACDNSGLSKSKIAKALDEHTGPDFLSGHRWTVERGEKNVHTYSLLKFLTPTK